ncbi:MAG: DUF3575 domain-containing protein [Muribaculaceae bacterium]|nr:DUF3575 domain-containing protein [Muribaculaceae bacterium]
MNKFVTIATIILLTASLQSKASIPSDSTEIFFRQGHSTLLLNMGDNRSRLDSIVDKINSLNSGSTYNLKSIRFIGSASPEGSVSINNRLSVKRANTLFNYLHKYTSFNDSITSFEYTGRDWKGLLEMVQNDKNVPQRDEVINVLNKIISSVDAGNQQPDNLINKLKTIGNGRAYQYLYYNIYPALRFSKVTLDYIPSLIPIDIVALTPELIDIDYTATMPDLIHAPLPVHKPFYMALKTNLLYDAAALPNIGAEFYLGKNWSAGANWTYGWWDKDKSHHYWRAYGGELYGRWWFGEKANAKPLTGHHLGIFAGIITYDFELGGKGYMGGRPGETLWDRCNRYAGIEYGYSLPVGRRLNIDFSLGAGYAGGKVVKYKPSGDRYIWEKTKKVSWFGPVKAEISLVWLIGRGNVNLKGGK